MNTSDNNLLILPGNSPINKDWGLGIQQTFTKDYKSTYVQMYDHWQTGEKFINLDIELSKLTTYINTLDSENISYVFMSKSAGSLLTLKGIYDGVLKPKYIILFGVPIKWANDTSIKYEPWFISNSVPTLFIQQEDDPYCTFKELDSKLSELTPSNYKAIQIKGNDHSYTNYNELSLLINNFIKGLE